jgi:hypothetical protein
VTSVIANVNGAAAKTTTMGVVVAIGRDAMAVVSVRGTVADRGSITSGAGKGPAMPIARASASLMTTMIVAVVVTLLLSAALPSVIVRSHAPRLHVTAVRGMICHRSEIIY